jgi:hypothetical protein
MMAWKKGAVLMSLSHQRENCNVDAAPKKTAARPASGSAYMPPTFGM